MNPWLIISAVLSFAATIIAAVGIPEQIWIYHIDEGCLRTIISSLTAFFIMVSVISEHRRNAKRSREQKQSEDITARYVANENAKERPNLSLVSCIYNGKFPHAALRIANHGRVPAESVSIVTLKHPSPYAMASGIRFSSLANGQTTEVNFNLWGALDPRLHGTENDLIEEIKSGAEALRMQIRIDYTYREETYSSPVYDLIWWAPDTFHANEAPVDA